MSKVLMEVKSKTIVKELTRSIREEYLKEVHIWISFKMSVREFCEKKDTEKDKWRKQLISMISSYINGNAGVCIIELNTATVYPYERMEKDLEAELNKKSIRIEEFVITGQSGKQTDHIQFYYFPIVSLIFI